MLWNYLFALINRFVQGNQLKQGTNSIIFHGENRFELNSFVAQIDSKVTRKQIFLISTFTFACEQNEKPGEINGNSIKKFFDVKQGADFSVHSSAQPKLKVCKFIFS